MDKSTLNKLKNIEERFFEIEKLMADQNNACLLYTSDAADD